MDASIARIVGSLTPNYPTMCRDYPLYRMGAASTISEMALSPGIYFYMGNLSELLSACYNELRWLLSTDIGFKMFGLFLSASRRY